MKTKLKKWKKISSRVLFHNKYFNVHEDTVRRPDGSLSKYYINHPHGRAVHVLAFDDKGRMLLTKEYRHPVGRVIFDVIGGSIEHDETPLQAAKRETLEETGFTATHWKLLGTYYANPSRSGTVFYVFMATGLRAGLAHPEPGEYIEVEFLPVRRLDSMMKSGKIEDAYFLASYYLYRLKHHSHGRC